MKLAEKRQKKNLTQEQMATLLGIATSTYNQYENSQRGIPTEIVKKISKILDIEAAEFFLPSKFTISK